jgi:hypothetical protein
LTVVLNGYAGKTSDMKTASSVDPAIMSLQAVEKIPFSGGGIGQENI